jgi:hypothetical protein
VHQQVKLSIAAVELSIIYQLSILILIVIIIAHCTAPKILFTPSQKSCAAETVMDGKGG